jgi:hypothetical protein
MLTGVVVGAGLGIAVGGALVDASSPHVALATATACGVVAALVAHLRGGTLTPVRP